MNLLLRRTLVRSLILIITFNAHHGYQPFFTFIILMFDSYGAVF